MNDEITKNVEKLAPLPISEITIGELPSAYLSTLTPYELELLKERNDENE